MPWCPKCKFEYRDGFDKCSDCDVDLVEELEKEDPVEYDSTVFLITAKDTINAEMMESMLNDHGIPVLKKYRETGGYLNIYMGMTNYGVDLYVPSQSIDQAKEVILPVTEELPLDQQEEGETKVEEEASSVMDQEYQKKKLIRVWIILLVFIPGFLWFAFMLIMRLIRFIE